jgi:ankyrin repeat protein
LLANNLDVVELLIAKDADLTEGLLWAVTLNYTHFFKIFYENTPAELQRERLHEALSEAASCGHLESCKLLCDLGANPTALDGKGDSSVHYAAEKGFLECVQYLLQDQESVDVRNKKGETPLMLAIMHKQRDVVKWLLNNKRLTSMPTTINMA